MNQLYKTLVYLLIIVCSLISNTVTAQTAVNDTLSLDPLRIEATRFDVPDNRQALKITRFSREELELFTGTPVSNILTARGSILMREYGIGGLATSSPRGYNPSRSQVLWNGFVINDPMNGTVDFSLIPSAFIDQLSVIPGNSSTAYGNRSAGGSILLESGYRSRQISAWQSIGSFGKNLQGASANWYSGNWHGSLKFQHENSDNDFTYSSGADQERRTNNKVSGINSLLDIGYSGSAFSYRSTLWLYDIENQSPGSLSFPSQTALQTDRSVKWVNRFNWTLDNSQIEAGILFVNNDQSYTDSAFGINSNNVNRQYSTDISWRYHGTENFELFQSIYISSTEAEAADYNVDRHQWVLGYQLNPRLELTDYFQLFAGARYDYYETAGDAVSGSLGFNTELINNALFLRGQASRNFVAPTFNDLYWVPSGNLNLKPETNRKIDLGLLHVLESGTHTLETDITLFAGDQKDGILWIFNGDLGYFQANNIDAISTRGFEITSDYTQELQNAASMTGGVSITYNKSTIEEDQYDDNRTVGNQLIYVPEWQLTTYFQMNLNRVSAGFNIVWSDERYSSQDHMAAVDPLNSYAVSRAHTTVRIPFSKNDLQVIGRIENLFDKEYQVINGYPMPGRHFLLTARFNYRY